ncbi:MAG TPA: DNA-binding response regulator [Syntrophobacteraceae bacterium]|nr:DNA-binding response regulator [Syntrophobacteraceae bacterium]HBD09630.1 DNA-binding response regulator [Syntrophobacteraceae bacterium]
MEKATVLIVEDDRDILELLTYTIRGAGFDVVSAEDGLEALVKARLHRPAIVILDLMLPGMDGLDVCRELKRSAETSPIAVIMLTARGEEVDRIVGLELGADDYVVKPFSPREVVLRIRAVLRRTATPEKPSAVFEVEGLEVDLEAHRVKMGDHPVELTVTEFKLLAELIRNRGKVQSRDTLLDKVWGYRFEGYARTVDTHVRRLRHKLGPFADRVETVRGVGYRFRE